MSRNVLVAGLIAVVAGAVVLFVFATGSRSTNLALDPEMFEESTEVVAEASDPGEPSAQSDELEPLPIEVSEALLPIVTVGTGAAELSGVVRTVNGDVVPLAKVELRRSGLVEEEALGGTPSWSLFDWRRFRDERDPDADPFPERLRLRTKVLATARADAEGRFTFQEIGTGRYFVAVDKSALLHSAGPTVLIEQPDAKRSTEVIVETGELLRGRVVDGEGNPVPEANVRVRSEYVQANDFAQGAAFVTYDELMGLLLNGMSFETTTDANGDFELPALLPYDARITVNREPYAETEVFRPLPFPESITIELGPGAVVRGVVTNPEGNPIGGAVVEYQPRSDGGWTTRFRERSRRRYTESDREGLFEFAGLEATGFSLQVEAPGHIDSTVRGTPLDPGGVQVVEVEMVVGATIAGIVLSDVGAPIEGAKVQARSQDRSQRRRGRRGGAEVETDARGVFRFAELEPGSYSLNVEAEGFVEQRDVEAETNADSVEIELELGRTLSGRIVDVAERPIEGAEVFFGPRRDNRRAETGPDGEFEIDSLPTDSAELRIEAVGMLDQRVDTEPMDLGDVAMQPAVKLRGFVLDGGGVGVPGARVDAREIVEQEAQQGRRRGGPGNFRNNRRGRGATAYSGADGGFEVALPIPQGAFSLRARAAGFADGEVDRVVVNGSDIDGLSVTLEPGARIVGFVRDNDGSPVFAADVYARTDGRRWSRASGAGRTDELGRYTIEGLEPGTYRIEAQATGYANARVEGIEAVSGRTASADVVISPERRLLGVVLDALGNPVPNARVSGNSGSNNQRTQTGVDGTFNLGGLADELIRVSVRADGFVRKTIENVDPLAGELTIELETAFSVTGIVMDSETRLPIERARVQLTVGEGQRRRFERTDETGAFEIEGLQEGTYTVSITANGYISSEAEAIVPAAAELYVEMEPGGRITGLVLAEGRPVEDARIRPVLVAGLDGSQSTTDDQAGGRGGRGGSGGARGNQAQSEADGSFVAIGLEDGIYRLEIDHPEYLPMSLDEIIVIRGEPTPNLDLVLTEGSVVEGRVANADGTRFDTGRIVASGPDSFRRTSQIRDGSYRVAGLPEGKIRLQVYPSRGRTSLADIEVEVKSGQQKRIDLALDATGQR